MWNNTYIYNSTYNCSSNANASQAECEAAVGGFFEQDKSTTWVAASNSSILNLPTESAQTPGNLYGTDTIHLNSTYTLPQFAFGFNNGVTNEVANFGLGQNSSLLNGLYSAGAIPSRVWSLYNGWNGAASAQQADGSIVFGGYDTAKATGPNITLPFAANDDFELGQCPNKHIVTISDIKMNLKNGSSPSILGTNNGAAFRACLLPNYSYIALSYDIWSSFLQISGSTSRGRSTSPLSLWQMLIAANGAYDGDLTFRFYPGLDITIPNHQLITPEYDFDKQGHRYNKNDTNRLTQIYSLEGASKDWMPSFGMGFFSAAYMMVDNDRQQFTLWKGQPSTTQNLVSMGPAACSAVPSTTGSGSGPAVGDSASRPRGQVVLDTGTLSGAVVGGVALAVCCFTIVWVLAKRRARRRHEVVQDAKHSSFDSVSDAGYAKPTLPEHRENKPPVEMPLCASPSYVLPPYEVAARSTAHEMPPGSQGKSVGGIYELPATPRRAGFPRELSGEVPRDLRNKFLPEVPGEKRSWI